MRPSLSTHKHPRKTQGNQRDVRIGDLTSAYKERERQFVNEQKAEKAILHKNTAHRKVNAKKKER